MEEQVRADLNRLFIIDVEGGRGHILQVIQKDIYGKLEAKIILQIMSRVLDSVSADGDREDGIRFHDAVAC